MWKRAVLVHVLVCLQDCSEFSSTTSALWGKSKITSIKEQIKTQLACSRKETREERSLVVHLSLFIHARTPFYFTALFLRNPHADHTSHSNATIKCDSGKMARRRIQNKVTYLTWSPRRGSNWHNPENDFFYCALLFTVSWMGFFAGTVVDTKTTLIKSLKLKENTI